MALELPFDTTVVMVDDDEEDVLMLRTAARRTGQEIRIVHLTGGPALLDALDQSTLPERCVVLLDLNMPTMDGFTVLERLRLRPRGELLPVVVYTTTSDQVQVDRAYASGANAFLTKPSSLGESTTVMQAVIAHWLAHGRVPLTPRGDHPSGDQVPREVDNAAVRTSQSRLLVVDDDPDLAAEIRMLLRGSQRDWVIDAQPTVEGLGDRLRQGDYDVWILDHHLAGMVGDQVLRLLPADVQRPPVVVVTGSADPTLPETYLSLGVADFLTKEELKPALLDRTLRFAMAQWQAKQALERSQQDLLRSERLATIGRMASGVAHEYNNLNAVVLAGLERLYRHLAGNSAAHDLVTRVLGTVERSRRISESLLTLGRPTEAEATVIDLRPHLADTLALMELRARRFGATLRLDSGEQSCPVRIDRNDLHQVLSNLVVNALHAVHCATAPEVVVRIERRARQIVLTVRDNGVGIDAEDMPRLFQPFFSRKGPHDRSGLFPASIGGTGLGLPVCQVLINRAGGDLKVSSRSGLGTTVSVTLPLCEDTAPPALTVPSADSASGEAAPSTRRQRVVALDDNTQLSQLLHEALTDAGIPVRVYIDPLRFLAEQPFDEIDLLVLDWQMPGMGGGEVLQHLGDAQRASPLRVLIISGEPPVVPNPTPPGVVILGVVMKPFRLAELIERINGG